MIWVAQSTYYPTAGADRSVSFVLKNGVKMYGGFEGTETDLEQRDFMVRETILSGNIGLPNGSDNAYHVLYGEGLDSTTWLDGFVVTKGVANGSDDYSTGGGLLINPSSDVYNTCPTIQNCRFESNYATSGGAIAVPRWHFSQNYANPIIRNCQFVSNRAGLFGGAMAKIGPSLVEKPFILENCVFTGNASGLDGGGIFFSKTENVVILQNCDFEKDTSKSSLGGGIYFASGYEEMIGATLIIDSCSFKQNIATEGGALYYLDGGLLSFGMPPFQAELSYCVFEGNIAKNGYGGAYGFVGFDHSKFDISIVHCEFKGNLSSSNYATFFQATDESTSNIVVRACKYLDNKLLGNPSAKCYPLGFGIGGPGSRMEAIVENCVFAGNGGGVSGLCTLNGGGINTYVNNCTFYDNRENVFTKSYFSVFNEVDHFNHFYVKNTVIWQPDANVWEMFADNDLMTSKLDGYEVNHCLLSLDSFTTQFHTIFGSQNISETDPLFVNAANQDFRLEACSPAVNAGDNTVVDSFGILNDLNGNARIQFETVDIGAYETQDSCFSSGNSEPLGDNISATLFPNPGIPGGFLTVQTLGFEHPALDWAIRDVNGRLISSDRATLWGKGNFLMESPTFPGIYFLELRSPNHSFWLNFIVQP